MHPAFSWPSGFTKYFPQLPQLAVLSRIHDLPIIGYWSKRYFHTKWMPSPNEPFRVFRNWDPNFDVRPITSNKRPFPRDPSNINQSTKNSLRWVVEAHMRYQAKKYFSTKVTGRPGINYLRNVFPDCKFVHVYRSPLDVIYSLYRKAQDNWFPADEVDAWLNYWPNEWSKRIESSDHGTIAFLAYYYLDILSRIERQSSALNEESLFSVKYGHFTSDPFQVLAGIFNVFEMSMGSSYQEWVRDARIENANGKWEHGFSTRQVSIVQDIVYNAVVSEG